MATFKIMKWLKLLRCRVFHRPYLSFDHKGKLWCYLCDKQMYIYIKTKDILNEREIY
jgi:hypothetical protein